MTPNLFITNDFDAPIPRLITEEQDGQLIYIHPSMQERWAGRPMQMLNATKLEDFGIRLAVEKGMLKGMLDPTLPVTAKYHDGKPRHWQGPAEFSFEYPPKPVSAKFNILDHIPNPKAIGADEYTAIYELLDTQDCHSDPELAMAVCEEFKGWAQRVIDDLEAALLKRSALGH